MGRIKTCNPDSTNATFFCKAFRLTETFELKRIDEEKVPVCVVTIGLDELLEEMAQNYNGAVVTMPLEALLKDAEGRRELPCPRGAKIVAINCEGFLYKSKYETYAFGTSTRILPREVKYVIVPDTPSTISRYEVFNYPLVSFFYPVNLLKLFKTLNQWVLENW
ncbi:MAG: hypothetical protein N2654_07805 [Deltaproteobacteria bacterium]|nr:hypothetical protein [Deltaproteobacteria bacterium]